MGEFYKFPWEKGIKPYFINPEGFEWYIDEELTEYAKKDLHNHKGLKNVVGFYVKKGNDITRVLIDNKQRVLSEDQTLDGMYTKVDILKFIYQDEDVKK
jgi:hypothetical protein